MGWLIFFGYLSVILLPPIGLILGSVLVLKERKGHGFTVIGLSVAALAIAILVPVSNDQNSDDGGMDPEAERILQESQDRAQNYASCLFAPQRLGPCGNFLHDNP